MLSEALAEYNRVLSSMRELHTLYEEIYDLYRPLEDVTLRIDQSYWYIVMTKLDLLLKKLTDTESTTEKLSPNLKCLLNDRWMKLKNDSLMLKRAFTEHDKIKNNWVRIRIWRAGHYDGNRFVPGTVLHSAARSLWSDNTYVGHASVETAEGYFSLWPGPQGTSRYFNSLYEDLRDEGPTTSNLGEQVPREPEVIIDLFSLDAGKVSDWCRNYVREVTLYLLKPKPVVKLQNRDDATDNCVTAAFKALQAGGIEFLYTNADAIYKIFNTPTPDSFRGYLEQVEAKEAQSFGKILTSLKVPERACTSQNAPAIFRLQNYRLKVTTPYTPQFGGVRLAKGDILVLERMQANGMLLCRFGEKSSVLVPQNFVEMDCEAMGIPPPGGLQLPAAGYSGPSCSTT